MKNRSLTAVNSTKLLFTEIQLKKVCSTLEETTNHKSFVTQHSLWREKVKNKDNESTGKLRMIFILCSFYFCSNWAFTCAFWASKVIPQAGTPKDRWHFLLLLFLFSTSGGGSVCDANAWTWVTGLWSVEKIMVYNRVWY